MKLFVSSHEGALGDEELRLCDGCVCLVCFFFAPVIVKCTFKSDNKMVGCAADLSVQDLYKLSLCKDSFERAPHMLCIRAPLARSRQDLCNRCPLKVWELITRTISEQDVAN